MLIPMRARAFQSPGRSFENSAANRAKKHWARRTTEAAGLCVFVLVNDDAVLFRVANGFFPQPVAPRKAG